MYKVIIADDEPLARNRLNKLLAEIKDFEVIAEASDGLMALELTNKLKPDVLFLDIEMPGMNGLEVAKKLGIRKTKIIFVTGYDEFALDAFESNTIDYLVKPIKKERLHNAYKKLLSNYHAKLHIKIGDNIKTIQQDHIYYIRSDGPYSNIKTCMGDFLCNDTLERLMVKLDMNQFFRIHRGTILNLSYLKELKRLGDRKFEVHIDEINCKSILKVSRSYLGKLKQKIVVT